MRTAALIENGHVVNVIVIEQGSQGDETLIDFNAVEITDQDVRIGDAYNGNSFTRIKTESEIEGEKVLAEYLQKKQALIEKLGLTQDEASILFGL